MPNDSKPSRSFDFLKSLGFLQRITYGGPVGKIGAVGVTALIVIGAVVMSCWGNQLVHLAGLGTVFAIVLVVLFFIRQIVNEHPQLATLEGKQVVDFTQLQLAAKYHPALPDPSTSIDPEPPMIEAPSEEEE